MILAGLQIVQNKNSGRLFNILDYHSDNKFDKAAIKDFLVLSILHTHMDDTSTFIS